MTYFKKLLETGSIVAAQPQLLAVLQADIIIAIEPGGVGGHLSDVYQSRFVNANELAWIQLLLDTLQGFRRRYRCPPVWIEM